MQKSKNDITSQVQKATRYDSTQLTEKNERFQNYSCHLPHRTKVLSILHFFGKNKNNCGDDFDEEGEEITLYRTVTEKKTVQVGTEKVLKNVIDYSMVDRLGQVSYEFLIKELKEHFPAKVIKTV